MSKRQNGEGSFYPLRDEDGVITGYAAYVWVETPTGKLKRKYLYGKDPDKLRERWTALKAKAQKGPISTDSPTIASYLGYWLDEVIKPQREPKTYEGYESFTRLHIIPWIGPKQLHKLRPKDLQKWVNELAKACQCCQQGKDANRPQQKQKCCAKGRCCEARLSKRTISDIRACLRSALNHAIIDEHIEDNPAEKITLAAGRKRRKVTWSSDEACRFMEQTRHSPLHAAFVLMLVMGLRKGEILGATWEDFDLDGGLDEGEFRPTWQLQRVHGELIHKRLKTEDSENAIPMPEICVKALRARRERQKADRAKAAAWHETNLVFTSKHGVPVEPRNFNRYFDWHREQGKLGKITLHDARRTCARLLVDLDVHPRVIMAIMRHADFNVTMEIYAQASTKKIREALKRLGDSLEG